MKNMSFYFDYFSLISGLLCSILTFSVYLAPHNHNDIIEAGNKIKDLKNMVKWSLFSIFIISVSFLYEIQELKKEDAYKAKRIELLTKQENNLDSANRILQKKNDSTLRSFVNTRDILQNVIANDKEISTEIENNVIVCFNDIAGLSRAADNSITVINTIKNEFYKCKNEDDYDFSQVEIEYYNKSLEILKSNANNTKRIYSSMGKNLFDILKLARKLKLRNSDELIKKVSRYENNYDGIIYNEFNY